MQFRWTPLFHPGGVKSPYSRIKGWARFAADASAQVIVNIGKRVTVVLPNKEVDVGAVESQDHIMVGELNVPAGHLPDWDAYVVKAADIPEVSGTNGLSNARPSRLSDSSAAG